MPLILDSGAFCVFSRGETIELNEYIKFCIEHPKCSYYVNLDKMPGKKGAINKALTTQDFNEAAEVSWNNLKNLSQYIPKEKIITVFHQGEDFEYLNRMLDNNYSYIGLGFAVYRQASQTNKIAWLMQCKSILDKYKIFPKVHGFGITSLPVLQSFPWHSVDSAAWIHEANCGNIFVPAQARGEFDFTQAPYLLAVSDTNPITSGRNLTWSDMTPNFAQGVKDWICKNQMPIGTWTQKTVTEGYKLKRGKERWWNPYPKLVNKGKGFGILDIPEAKRRVIIIKEKGIRTDDQFRKQLNARYLFKINESLSIDYLYLAGLVGKNSKHICPEIPNRLLSYAHIRNRKEAQDSLAWHMEHTK